MSMFFRVQRDTKEIKGSRYVLLLKSTRKTLFCILFLKRNSIFHWPGHALCSHNRISVFPVMLGLSVDKLKRKIQCINIVFSAGAAGTTGSYSSEFYCIIIKLFYINEC